ncbi:hypothetical protein TNCV_630771 [Trichonephila clavipes]|nr:hypothetical protein TNCV_630771 [Trichonephila clavipes]
MVSVEPLLRGDLMSPSCALYRLVAHKTPSTNKIMHDHMLRVISLPSAIDRIFDYCPGHHGLQICQPLKTSGNWLVKDRPATPF